MNDHVARMLSDAQERLHDAELLATSGRATSDSVSLLRILALEVLLKAAQLVSLGKYKRTHNYVALWSDLPDRAKAEVLAVAEARCPGHANLSNLDSLFKNWEFAFTKGRYYFELYEGYSLAQQRDLSELWVEIGAPLNEAEVQFHPLELLALVEGLVGYIKNAP